MPKRIPNEIQKGFIDHRYDDIQSLKRIDKITVKMEFEFESHIYHFHPQYSKGKVILYHQGHKGDFYHGKQIIKKFLAKGFSILGFCMPLLGLNNNPVIHFPRIGNIRLTFHDQIGFLEPPNGHPVKFFVEPVIVAINYCEKLYDYKEICMVGISGAGWTTTLAAAIDKRIKASFPVAGTYPLYLRANSKKDWSDWEQLVPELYKTVNYLEMYVLGGYGNGRVQIQIINKHDSCCFAGVRWRTYKNIVSKRVAELGKGCWDLFMDDSHISHLISEVAFKKIIQEYEGD